MIKNLLTRFSSSYPIDGANGGPLALPIRLSDEGQC